MTEEESQPQERTELLLKIGCRNAFYEDEQYVHIKTVGIISAPLPATCYCIRISLSLSLFRRLVFQWQKPLSKTISLRSHTVLQVFRVKPLCPEVWGLILVSFYVCASGPAGSHGEP